jgi:hypothetical protein
LVNDGWEIMISSRGKIASVDFATRRGYYTKFIHVLLQDINVIGEISTSAETMRRFDGFECPDECFKSESAWITIDKLTLLEVVTGFFTRKHPGRTLRPSGMQRKAAAPACTILHDGCKIFLGPLDRLVVAADNGSRRLGCGSSVIGGDGHVPFDSFQERWLVRVRDGEVCLFPESGAAAHIPHGVKSASVPCIVAGNVDVLWLRGWLRVVRRGRFVPKRWRLL